MRMDALATALDDLKRRGIRPKYIYTVPTVQNPTGTILSEARRHDMLRLAEQHGVPIFEDDCYSDLIWDGQRPPALHAHEPARRRHPYRLVLEIDRAGAARRLHRRRLEPASRACWRSRPMPAPARWSRWFWANSARRISTHHVPALTRGLRKKLETLMDALNEQFGTAAEFEDPKGGIFLWVKLPDQVDTLKLYQPALAAGVAINPGPEWTTDKSLRQEPHPAVLRQSVPRSDPRRRRRSGRSLPPRIRRAEPDCQCGAGARA